MAASSSNETPKRRGFLKALGVSAGAAAAAGAAVTAEAQTARPQKENAQDRVRQRYQPNAAGVQAFYRTNRGQ
jgi:hypothetical protein